MAMKDQSKENEHLKHLARVQMLRGIRTRALKLRKDTDSTATWDQAERDRADLLGLYELMMDRLMDVTAAAKALDERLRLDYDVYLPIDRTFERSYEYGELI